MKKMIVASALVLAALPAHAGFDEVVAHLTKYSGLSRTYIPFAGLARLAVKATSPDGVHDIRMAVFEGRRSGNEVTTEALRAAAGKEWQPFVQTRSESELTTIYAMPDGKMMRLLIVAQEKNEAAVIEVKVDPDRVSDFVDQAK